MHQLKKDYHLLIRGRFSWLLLLCSLIVIGGFSCSKAAQQNRYIEKANDYFKDGEFEKAEIEYLNALRSDPRDPLVLRQLAIIYHDQGRKRAALQFLSRAKQLSP